MTLTEAIKIGSQSGKPWRRASWGPEGRWRWAPGNLNEGYTEKFSDLTADDWEVREAAVTITRSQFLEALESSLSHDSIAALARKLGLSP